ncbi:MULTISPECIES: hypothetical protein [Flavobacterium]|uniref:PsbP C-terminal domain-containing protein n=1 Tax=Flavobacterium hankyongi TaxID=1176532 RepID=A0ABP9A3N9_9FLAO|nr:hypothetical protein [Flavobacterium sp. N1846]
MKKIILFLLLVISISTIAQEKIENLKVNWPEEYKWKIANNQENETVHFVELVPDKESLENWSIIGTMMSLKNVRDMGMDKAADLFYSQTKQNAQNAKLTILEKNEQDKYPWILFKIEVEEYLDDIKPESQVYYIIQGDSSLYVNLVGIKEKKISKKFEEKWSKVFKSSEIVFQ